jgi:ribosomal protein L37AE/L43A
LFSRIGVMERGSFIARAAASLWESSGCSSMIFRATSWTATTGVKKSWAAFVRRLKRPTS